jgi:hypothetical protein
VPSGPIATSWPRLPVLLVAKELKGRKKRRIKTLFAFTAFFLQLPRTVIRPDDRVLTIYYFNGPQESERAIEATFWTAPK